MRGTILGVHGGRGILSSADERRIEFALSEWRSGGSPAAGQVVDFLEQDGEAKSVFAVPGATSARPASQSMLLASIGIACLVLGFVIPLVPTIAAFVLGVIGAGQAKAEQDETALVLSRIAWIGAVVFLIFALLALLALFTLLGTLGFAAIFHGFGETNF
jgi:hypothetical protein